MFDVKQRHYFLDIIAHIFLMVFFESAWIYFDYGSKKISI